MAASSSSIATPPGQASGLVINTLTFDADKDRTVTVWLQRNNLDIGLLHGLSCSLRAEFGVPHADRNDRFVGMTFALLDILIPSDVELPAALCDGLEFAPSGCQLASGAFFQMRHIVLWLEPLKLVSPVPCTREGWPLPFVAALECLEAAQRSAVLFMMSKAVLLKCSMLDSTPVTTVPALKSHKRNWQKLRALLHTMEESSRGRPTTASTMMLPLVWANPQDLPSTDSCVTHTSPGVWLNQCCVDGGVWNMRPDLDVPAATWVPAVLHTLKARVLTSIVTQRAVSPHRMLRGHINPKMANVFWVSCSAITGEVPQGAPGHEETWRHCLIWKIGIHQLRSLPADCSATAVWQAGTVHVLESAPRTRGGRGRMTFSPASDDCGETLVLVLDYAGPAITTFMTLRRENAALTGPVRAALALSGPLYNPPPPSENTLQQVFCNGWETRLPASLQIIDEEQRAILSSICDSTSPVHVIHALAGCGKSTVIQCLVALYAAWHERLSPEEQGSEVLMVTLRTRTLRHEFLQGLLHHMVLKPGQVIFGGLLPDRLLDAGSLDDDVAHFEKVILSAPAVNWALDTSENCRLGLERLHEDIMQLHYADGLWITDVETAQFKTHARDAMRVLWAFHEAYDQEEAVALGKVAVALVTTDVALKLWGKAANPGSPAARLMKKKQPTALIMDEMQRCPAETYLALASNHTTLVAVGDRGQELYPLHVQQPCRGGHADRRIIQVQTFLGQSRQAFAAELLIGREKAAPGAPDSPAIHHLTETKRFGDPLAMYLARGYTQLCASLRASSVLGKRTPVFHVWYKAPCESWYNLEYFLSPARKWNYSKNKTHQSWELTAAVWNDGLSSCLAASI